MANSSATGLGRPADTMRFGRQVGHRALLAVVMAEGTTPPKGSTFSDSCDSVAINSH